MIGYKIREKLYESKSSVVYKGYKESNQQEVILKFLNREYPTPEEIARFEREYELTRSLASNGIIKAYNLEKYKDTIFMVLEDFGGNSFKKYLTYQKIVLKEFLNIAIQITEILAQIHERNIVHKDVNPTNIIYNPETKQIKIIDFGISTELSYESPAVLEGTITYISPEQTGRVNRMIDYRTDFYSLGMSLYELLTGQAPFISEDIVELVYLHIAKYPEDVYTKNPDTPKIISSILRKMYDKDADKRYQSAKGIKRDFEKCLEQLEKSGDIPEFPLGMEDYSDKFHIPHKLYGREKELNILIHLFEKVANTVDEDQYGSAILLVSGYSGIGKSSFIYETQKPITQKKGFFLEGKFDQLQRNIPFYAIITAFKGLLKQLLTEPEKELHSWREKILKAVGVNGQVIIDLIPELEYIIGKQSPVSQLSPIESMNRFNLSFQNFISVFAQKEHPLVLFFDDLQWADVPSLNLIKNLITNPDIQYFLIIGSFRDNEVDASHPLNIMIDEVRKTQKNVQSIHLKSLEKEHVYSLLSETLQTKKDSLMPMVELLYQKTDGNPFFLSELLKELYKDKIILFNYKTKEWNWKDKDILSYNVADNVADLMVKKLNKLSKNTQETLSYSACLGNKFKTNTLSLIMEGLFNYTYLHPPIQEGMLLKVGENLFRFQHDRVQDAAYSFLEESKKKEIHLKIGRLLFQDTLDNTNNSELEKGIFDIVSHYNFGSELISEDSEKIRLIELNLQAAKKAKQSVAFQGSLKFLRKAVDILSNISTLSSLDPTLQQNLFWTNHYELALELYTELSELEYLNGNFEEAENYFELVLDNAKKIMERMRIWEIQLQYYSMQNRFKEALDICYKALEELGEPLPTEKYDPLPDIMKSKQLLGNRPIEDLNQNIIQDQNELLTVRMLNAAFTPAYISHPVIIPFIILKAVNLSLEFGMNPYIPFLLGGYGCFILGLEMNDFESALQFGKLSISIVEKLKAVEIKSKTYLVLSSFINHWRVHARESDNYFQTCIQSGLEIGDFEFATYGICNMIHQKIFMGVNLFEVQKCIHQYSSTIKRFNLPASLVHFYMWEQFVFNLRGEAKDILLLKGERFDEEKVIEEVKNNITLLQFIYLCKSILHYLFGDYERAYNFSTQSLQYEAGAAGMMTIPEVIFFNNLAIIAKIENSNELDKIKYLEAIQRNQTRMKVWAENCEANYGHKYWIIEAELARINSDFFHAISLYSKAIEIAKKYEYTLEEAIANELAHSFWCYHNNIRYAKTHLLEAHRLYKKWGSIPKIKQLEERYSEFFENKNHLEKAITVDSSLNTDTISSNTIDFISILSASQVLSGEIEHEKLLEKLIKIVIENAGAEKGLLLLVNDNGSLTVQVEGTNNSESVKLPNIPLEESSNLSVSVVQYIARTQETLVLNDATSEGLFVKDEYIIRNKPKSLLCFPLVKQGKLTGIIYLENNLTTGAFTKDRIETIKILATQAAISIENSKLYNQMENLVEDRTKQLNNTLRLIKQDLNFSKKIQTRILPGRKEKFGNLKIVSRYIPMEEVGGDFFDIVELEDHIVRIFIADAAGHGVQAALITMLIKSEFESIKYSIRSPAILLQMLNNLFYNKYGSLNSLFTCFLVDIDEQDKTICYASAGHPSQVVVSQRKFKLLNRTGKISGAIKDANIMEMKTSFTKNEKLFLFTDGAFEEFNKRNKEFGEEQLYDMIKSNQRMDTGLLLDKVLENINEFLDGHHRHDDITLIGVEWY